MSESAIPLEILTSESDALTYHHSWLYTTHTHYSRAAASEQFQYIYFLSQVPGWGVVGNEP